MTIIYQNDAAPWVRFWVGDSSNNPVTGLAAADFSSTNVVRTNQSDTSVTFTDAASATDWAAGKLYEIGGGFYQVGVATSLISSFVGQISIIGTYASGTVYPIPSDVKPELALQAEVTKIPRSATALTAGGSIQKTNDSNSETINETINGDAP